MLFDMRFVRFLLALLDFVLIVDMFSIMFFFFVADTPWGLLDHCQM